MTAPLDPTKFAAAKLNLVLGAGLDPELPKLALRIVSLFVGRHMRAEHGGEAWPAVKTLCADLGVSSESKVRGALYALLRRGHLIADRKGGETTRYRIADRYFEGGAQPAMSATPACHEPGGEPQYGADPQPPIGADPQPPIGADPQPPIGATSTGNRNPGNEYREMKSGNGDSPPSPSRIRNEPSGGARAKPRPPSPAQTPSRRDKSPGGFDEFWAAYPLKVGKIGAEKAFRKALGGGANPEEITLGAMRYAAERDREPDPAKRRKHTKHPAGWLNDGRWADDPAPAPAYGGLPIFGGGYAAPRANTREGHGFRVMRVGEFQ